MKKLAIGILVTALLLAMAVTAAASEDYDALLLKDSGKTSDELCAEDTRSVTAAVLLLDYMLVTNKEADFLETFDWTKTCNVGLYGSCVDVFYPLNNGYNHNLFLMPSSGTISDYGETSWSDHDSHTYYGVAMSDVLAALGAAVDYLGN